jgi:hypothetical protein
MPAGCSDLLEYAGRLVKTPLFRDRPVTWSVPTQDCLEQRKHIYPYTEKGYSINSSVRRGKTVHAVLLKNISATCSQCSTTFSRLARQTGEVTGVNVMIACIGKLKLGLCHAICHTRSACTAAQQSSGCISARRVRGGGGVRNS